MCQGTLVGPLGPPSLAVSSRKDGAERPSGGTYTNGPSVWTSICSSSPSPAPQPDNPTASSSATQRAPTYVGRLGTLRHQPLPPRLDRFLPRLQPVLAGTTHRQDHRSPCRWRARGCSGLGCRLRLWRLGAPNDVRGVGDRIRPCAAQGKGTGSRRSSRRFVSTGASRLSSGTSPISTASLQRHRSTRCSLETTSRGGAKMSTQEQAVASQPRRDARSDRPTEACAPAVRRR
jgi:hypothetical protein